MTLGTVSRILLYGCDVFYDLTHVEHCHQAESVRHKSVACHEGGSPSFQHFLPMPSHGMFEEPSIELERGGVGDLSEACCFA